MKPIESALSGDALLKSYASCSADKFSEMTADCQTEWESEPPTFYGKRDLHILHEVPRAMWISKFDPAGTKHKGVGDGQSPGCAGPPLPHPRGRLAP